MIQAMFTVGDRTIKNYFHKLKHLGPINCVLLHSFEGMSVDIKYFDYKFVSELIKLFKIQNYLAN